MILDSFRLDGKNVLVTGSSRGLGAAIAMALAEAGANVGLHGRSPAGDGVCDAIRQMGRKCFFHAGDVSRAEVPAALIARTIDEFGSIDILVNNAGTIRRAPAAEYPQAFWDELIATNLSSVFHLSQLAGQHMLKRGAGGKIVNVASLLSFQGGILVPAYAAAKGGVALLTKPPVLLQVVNLFVNCLERTFVMPIYAIALLLFYNDQRTRQEGYDIDLLMANAGWSQLPLAAPPAMSPFPEPVPALEPPPAEIAPPEPAHPAPEGTEA